MLAHSENQVSRLTLRIVVVSLTLAVLCLFVVQARLVAATGILFADDTASKQLANDNPNSRRRMTTEIRARKEGRSAAEMYTHLTESFQRHGLEIGDWITNQETVVHAENAKLIPNAVIAKDIYVNLPEGSKLRAKLSGEELIVDPSGDTTMIYANGGSVVVLDEQGHVRFRSEPGIEDLIIETEIAEEISIRLRRKKQDGSDLDVKLIFDIESGIPEKEDQPHHNAVRYAKLTSDGEGPFRIKMQWIYNMAKLKQQAVDENNKAAETIKAFGRRLGQTR